MAEKRKPIRKKKIKTAVSQPKRKNTKRARDLPASLPVPRADFTKHSRIIRNQAATDFIVDPDGRSVRWHYERDDREYSKLIKFPTFTKWSIDDKWLDRRVEFWEQMEQRVIAHYADGIFRKRIEEMGKLEELVEEYEIYLKPLRDKKTGEVLRDENGLPKFGLDMPSIDKFMGMYLKVHERLMLLRGEATTRSEQLSDPKVTAHTEDPIAQKVNLNRTEMRALARTLLHARQPGLATPALEAEGETVSGDGEVSK